MLFFLLFFYRLKLHPKTTAAKDADTKIKKSYLRIEEAERDMRGGGGEGAAGGRGGGAGSVENR